MADVFDEERIGGAVVVAAHHEGNSLEVNTTVTPRPRLHRLV
jgi:hypothetical protein